MTIEQFLTEVQSVICSSWTKPELSKSDLCTIGTYRGMEIAFIFNCVDNNESWQVELLQTEPRKLWKSKGNTAQEAFNNLEIDF